jgi:hypothetical protein
MMVSALRFEGLQLKLFTHLMKSQNIDAQAKFDRRVGRNNGWNEMLDWKKQLDYGRHIRKVVTVEKASKEGEKKEDGSPGIGVTQQLFATTDFLDEPEKMEEDEGLVDNASIKSPNLLAASTDDEQEDETETATVLDKDTTIGTITQELEAATEELTPGGTRKRAWWEACTSCEEFPCVWAQYGKSTRDNDEILNLMIGSHNQPPSIVRRKRAFVHVATLLFGKMGIGHLKDMPACVVYGVRENWPAPNSVYSTDGVE